MPPVVALAVMVNVFRLNSAFNVVSALMVKEHIVAVPEHAPPDQPAKSEFASAVAVRVTIVPAVYVHDYVLSCHPALLLNRTV